MTDKNNTPVTKKDLDALADQINSRFDTSDARVELKLEQYAINMEERYQLQMNEFMNRIDPILREIENAREDRVIGSQQSHDIREQLSDHERRITRLENSS